MRGGEYEGRPGRVPRPEGSAGTSRRRSSSSHPGDRPRPAKVTLPGPSLPRRVPRRTASRTAPRVAAFAPIAVEDGVAFDADVPGGEPDDLGPSSAGEDERHEECSVATAGHGVR